MTGRTRRRRDPLTYEPKSLDEVWTHFEEPELPEDQYTYDGQLAHLRHVALTLAHPPNRQARIARAVIIGFLIFVFALAISGLFVG